LISLFAADLFSPADFTIIGFAPCRHGASGLAPFRSIFSFAAAADD